MIRPANAHPGAMVRLAELNLVRQLTNRSSPTRQNGGTAEWFDLLTRIPVLQLTIQAERINNPDLRVRLWERGFIRIIYDQFHCTTDS